MNRIDVLNRWKQVKLVWRWIYDKTNLFLLFSKMRHTSCQDPWLPVNLVVNQLTIRAKDQWQLLYFDPVCNAMIFSFGKLGMLIELSATRSFVYQKQKQSSPVEEPGCPDAGQWLLGGNMSARGSQNSTLLADNPSAMRIALLDRDVR